MTDQPSLLRPDDHADRAPDSVAVVAAATGQRISYRTMVDESKRLANAGDALLLWYHGAAERDRRYQDRRQSPVRRRGG
jgi:hypothetical protein